MVNDVSLYILASSFNYAYAVHWGHLGAHSLVTVAQKYSRVCGSILTNGHNVMHKVLENLLTLPALTIVDGCLVEQKQNYVTDAKSLLQSTEDLNISSFSPLHKQQTTPD